MLKFSTWTYHVALLRLCSAIHSDTVGWRCQLWCVRLDEATSINETSRREGREVLVHHHSFTNINVIYCHIKCRRTNEAAVSHFLFIIMALYATCVLKKHKYL